MQVDKEQTAKATRKLTPAEEAQMKVPIVSKDGQSRLIERIVGRQKLKKSYTYEIKFVGFDHRFVPRLSLARPALTHGVRQNAWIPRERLIELGFAKLVQESDDFEASREGVGSRETSLKAIREHLEGVGLNGDIAEYNEIKGCVTALRHAGRTDILFAITACRAVKKSRS